MEVRKIEAGEIITEPGVYDMPINWYHDNCCDGPSVSSSGLRAIDLQSPGHFWADSYLNPNREVDEEEESELEGTHFRLGRAAHWRMLEPEKFLQSIAVRPELWDSWRTKDAKEWRLDAVRRGMTVLIPSELKRVDGMAKSLKSHPLFEQGLLQGGVELSMFAKDERTGIWLKTRPDAMPIAEAITDLKVMQDVSPRAIRRAIQTLGYDMQVALGGIVWEKLTGQTIDQFYLVCIENRRPYTVHVESFSTTAVYWARIRIRHALDRLAHGLATGDWPGYDADGHLYGPSQKEAEDLLQAQKNALLPQEDAF